MQSQGNILAVLQKMGSDFCVDAQEEAVGLYGAPETFNTDQRGGRFTSEGFTEVLKAAESRISKDGNSRRIDNVIPL